MDVSRRRLLGGALAAAGVAGAGAVTVGRAVRDDDGDGDGDDAGGSTPPAHVPVRIPFAGPHQAGVLQRPPAAGIVAALRVEARDRDALRDALVDLSGAIRSVMDGTPPEELDPSFPALDSGVLGSTPPPNDVSVILGFGASLFDERFGLADQKPRELVPMPFFGNDRLDPDQSHGDLCLTVSAATTDAAMFALRQVLRATRQHLVLQWMIEGYNAPIADPTPGGAPVRNLMGFKDGTFNLDVDDPDVMDRYVWLLPGGREPAWAAGGSYQVTRIIRMFVEFWDRTRLSEQEGIMGKVKATGASLGHDVETDIPDYTADPDGHVVPLTAHVRLANPRTPETQDNLILRRGFSFTRGFDDAGRLDQGLLFSSFQSSLAKGFVAVQNRLNGEPLEEYIQAVGGGYFFVSPGVTTDDGFLGEGLFT